MARTEAEETEYKMSASDKRKGAEGLSFVAQKNGGHRVESPRASAKMSQRQARADHGLLGPNEEYYMRDRHLARLRQAYQDHGHEPARGGR